MSNKIIFALVLTLLFTTLSSAATINVPANYPTIQAAINNAANGDTIVVADGTYTEYNINFGNTNKNLYVRSASGNPKNCIINCNGMGRAFYLHAYETNATVISGFTIRNGSADYGAAIECYGASPSILNCVIENCSATYGGAIDIFYGAPLIKDCVIRNNTSIYDGSAIECAGEDSMPVIENCLFYGNTATNGHAALDFYDGCTAEILNCTIADNTGNDTFGGIQSKDSTVTVRNSILWNNGASATGDTITITYSCLKGAAGGTGNISSDPMFKKGFYGNYYLSQISAGQLADSPCVNVGDANTDAYYDNNYTTNTFDISDTGKVDLGYHYKKSGLQQQYMLFTKVETAGNGTVEPNLPGGQLYNKYAEITIKANAASGRLFSEWHVANKQTYDSLGTYTTVPGPNNIYNLTIDQNTIVIAKFYSSTMYKLTRRVKAGLGSITVSPSLYPDSSDPCSYYIPANSNATVTAIPSIGYELKNWYINKNGMVFDINDANTYDILPPTTNPQIIDMNENKTVWAAFQYTEYLLTTRVSGSNGTIAPKRAKYPAGTVVTLTATPNAGYRVHAWGGDAQVKPAWNTPTNTVKMDAPKDVNVTFEISTNRVISFTGSYPYTSLQDAINAANNGDTIVMAPGTYPAGGTASPNGFYISKSITILGNPEHPEQVVIDGNNYTCRAFYLDGTGGAKVTLNGLTITNVEYQVPTPLNTPDPWSPENTRNDGANGGNSYGAGIYMRGDHTISNCVIKNCIARGGSARDGGAGNAYDISKGKLPIHKGGFGGRGGHAKGAGIYIASGSPLIQNTIIKDCNAIGGIGGNGGAGLAASTNDPIDPNFPGGPGGNGGNGGDAMGGGVFCLEGTSPTFIACTIENCQARSGYGGDGGNGGAGARPDIDAYDPCDPNMFIQRGYGQGGHGGMPGLAYGGGVYVDDKCKVKFESCKVVGNAAKSNVAGCGGNSGGNTTYGGVWEGGLGGLVDLDTLNIAIIEAIVDANNTSLANIDPNNLVLPAQISLNGTPYAGMTMLELYNMIYQVNPDVYTAKGGGVFLGGYDTFFGSTITAPTVADFNNCQISSNWTKGSTSGMGGYNTDGFIGYYNLSFAYPSRHYRIPSFGNGLYLSDDSNTVFTKTTVADNFYTFENTTDIYPLANDYYIDASRNPIPGHPSTENSSTAIPPYTYAYMYRDIYGEDYQSYGGGLCFDSWTLNTKTSITDCNIAANDGAMGGGIYANAANIYVADSNLSNNMSYSGGGVFAIDSNGLIHNSLINDNTAGTTRDANSLSALAYFGTGGGIYAFSSKIDINDSTITANAANSFGGGICIEGDYWVKPLLKPLIKNNLITSNVAGQSGGGIAIKTFAKSIIQNCTITQNNVTSVNGSGGGIFASYSANITTSDNIIWGNTGVNGSQIGLSSGGPYTNQPPSLNISYSDIDLRAKAGLNTPGSSSASTTSFSTEKLIEANTIYDAINATGTAKVIVTLADIDFDTDWSSAASITMTQNAVAYRQAKVLSSLKAGEFTLRHKMKNTAVFSGNVTAAGLTSLLGNSLVAHIEPVRTVSPMLAQAIPMGNALATRSQYNGQNCSIAIVDSGVDYTHPRLGGGSFPNSKVIGGYDFGDNDTDPMPNSVAHGTCCAGIAAGNLGTVGDYIGGVAYGAKIYALKIGAGQDDSLSSDAGLAAWDWCLTHKSDNTSYPIRVISNSWGIYELPFDTAQEADALSPAFTAMAKKIVDAGITLLASSGNDGFAGEGISWPSAMSNVISVGAVYDTTGKVTKYSNTAANLDILAPADPVYTTDIVGAGGYSTGDYEPYFNGTSSACPFAAGCVAALQSAAIASTGGPLTPAQVETVLKATGTSVTDTKVAITKPLVNLESAIALLSTSSPIYRDDTQCAIIGAAQASDGSWTVEGSTNISADPNFTLGYYLANELAGQSITSPCVDTGSVYAMNSQLNTYTTRTDGVKDAGYVDMGYHYKAGLPVYNLVINVDTSAAGGTTNPLPGTYKKYSGDSVTITAVTDANSRVKEWIIDGATISTNAKKYTVTMDMAHTVTVVFEFYAARTIVVPDQYKTIQEAIDAAENGDVIYIYPKPDGKPHYIEDTEGLDFGGKAITIRSRFPDDPNTVANTIIDCNNRGRAFRFQNGEDANSVIEGITITNGLASGPIATGTQVKFDPTDANIYQRDGIDASGDGYGGAIYIGLGAKPTIRKCVFKNCMVTGGQGSDGGRGYDIPSNSQLSRGGDGGDGGDGSGNGYGGVIFCDERSAPAILYCTFTNNSAHGGIGGDGGDGGSGASGKTAGDGGDGGSGSGNGYGGAIYCSTESAPKILGCSFSKNLGGIGVGGAGGKQGIGQTPTQAPYPYDGSAGSSSGTGYGGAIYYEKGAKADINDCQILDGEAVATTGDTLGSGGGAIYFEPKLAASTIRNSTLAGNKASAGLGGAIVLHAGNELILNNCYLGGNSANTNGGAIAVGSPNDANSCKLIFTDCVFTSNTASELGGGIFAKNTDANFAECFVNRNTAYSGGGLYFVSKSSLKFIGGTINDNNAVGTIEAQGGGAMIMHMPAQFVNCQFIGNSSSYAGGGLMLNGAETADSNIINCLFAKNKAAVRGGAVVASLDSSPEIRNCTFSQNEADVGGKGGAIFCTFRSSPKIRYNIFDKNKRIAIYENSSDSTPVIYNNIFNNNYHGDYYNYNTDRLFNLVSAADRSTELAQLNLRTAAVTGGGYNIADVTPNHNEIELFRTGCLGDYYLRQPTADYPDDTKCMAVDAGYNINALDVTVFDGKTMAEYTTRTDSYLPDASSDTYDSGKLDLGFHYKDANQAPKLYLTTKVAGGKGTISPASGYVYRGTTVQLTAAPTTGWRVKQWLGTDDDSTTSKTNYVVMMTDRTVSVEFEQPRNLYIPAGYATLQEAINDAADGDKIIVSPGTYQYYDTNYDMRNGPTIDGKSITITSTNPDDPCVVAATVFKGGIFYIRNVDSSMILDGITIRDTHWVGVNGACPSNAISPDGINGVSLLGGAMRITNASPTIRNVMFINCAVGGGNGSNNCGTGGDGGWGGYAYGGAVGIAAGSSPVFKNCQFIGCYAHGGNGGDGDTSAQSPGHGGSWGDPNGNAYQTWDYADDSGGEGSYSPYWYYTAQGGAVYCSTDTHPVFQNCVFRDNYVVGGVCGISGPVWAWPQHRYVIEAFGGAVYMAAGSNADFTGCNFIDNFGDTRNQIADANVPGMYGESWVLSDNVVSYGGAIYAETADSIPTIKDCNFSGNIACAGGALNIEDSVFQISDSNFAGNASMLGGAMLLLESNTLLSSCDFYGNSAVAPAGQGGAVYSAASEPKFYDCRLLYNTASNAGGAGYFTGSHEPNMHNCLITHNQAVNYGGGLSANFDVQLHLSSCTVVHNQASGSVSFGGGLNCAYNANTTVINSIFWENEAQNGRQIAIGNSYSAADKQPAEVTVTYSNIQGGGAGIFCDQANGCLLYGFSEPSTNLYGTSLSSPQFVSSMWVNTPWNGYFLAAPDINEGSAQMQTTNNMCINAGSATAESWNMFKHTTRTDRGLDAGIIDLGYHYIRPATITGDFDFDGDVDSTDLLLFLEKWMHEDCVFPYYCNGRDFTQDGEVDFEDYAIFASYYQETEKVPPQPNPMTWATSPKSADLTSITMKATKAIDNSSNVIQYYFECTYGGGHSRGWDANSTFTDTGLTTGNTYGYRVKARDGRGNETGWSLVGYVKAGSDSTAPTPNPMTWLAVPALLDSSSVGMAATIATDISGVEYFFDETTGHNGGTDSGWISTNTYIDDGLEPNTVYTYRVKARDKSDNYNETGYSIEYSVKTPSSSSQPNPTVDKDPPTPNPGVWVILPYVTSGNPWYYHIMEATAATDATPPISYYFDCCEGDGTDSGWILSPHYEAGPFLSVRNSSYRYKTKDALGNESEWSPIVSTYNW